MFSLIALMAVMTVQAQSICGAWQNMKPEVTEKENGKAVVSTNYTFNEDGTFVSNADITFSETKSKHDKDMGFTLKASVIGVYTLKGNKLTLCYNGSSLKMDDIRLSIDGEVVDNPEFLTMVKDRLGNEAKARIAEELTDDHYTIKFSANGSMLELTDTTDGKTDRLMRMTTKN